MNRSALYSDHTNCHHAGDTTGWGDDTEPADEDDWVNVEPQLYRYGTQGNLVATGRVAGSEIMSGEGEPYFVERDAAGRVARVYYPDFTAKDKPEMEMRYTYTVDGKLKQVAAIDMESAYKSEYGPERYVVQFHYDDAGRLVRKVVRDNAVQDEIETRYESDYQYDGRGQMTRDRTIKYVAGTTERMQVMQDIQTTYDLGGNPTEIKFYDNYGWAYTEERTYARGYQLTGFSTSSAADVTVNTASSYTYDTNNNLTGTKKLDAYRTVNATKHQLAYRAQWTFTYDRKNRLKSSWSVGQSLDTNHLWYDGMGRIWQRWTYTGMAWESTLTRFVYDGSQMVQEHTIDVEESEGEWVYTYDDLTRDYLRHPAGTRQRERSGGNDTDYYLQTSGSAIEYKTERGLTASTTWRSEHTPSLDKMTGATFENISNLATSGNFIEMYGGGTSDADTKGFDPLLQFGGRHYLAGLGRILSISGNSPYERKPRGNLDSGLIDEYRKVEEYPQDTVIPEDVVRPDNGDGIELDIHRRWCICSTDRDVTPPTSAGPFTIRHPYYCSSLLPNCQCDCYCECQYGTVTRLYDRDPYPCPPGTKDPLVTHYYSKIVTTTTWDCHRVADAYTTSGNPPSQDCIKNCSTTCAYREWLHGGCKQHEGVVENKTLKECPPEQAGPPPPS